MQYGMRSCYGNYRGSAKISGKVTNAEVLTKDGLEYERSTGEFEVRAGNL